MAVTITSQKQLSNTARQLVYSSNQPDPTFFIYVDGVLTQTTKQTSIILNLYDNQSPFIEILDDPQQVPTQAFKGRVKLSWLSVPETQQYKVQEYASGAWIDRTIIDDLGQQQFSWTSRYLEDCQQFRFRVIPIGLNGNDGTPARYSFYCARYPDPPVTTFSYSDSTHKITIS